MYRAALVTYGGTPLTKFIAFDPELDERLHWCADYVIATGHGHRVDIWALGSCKPVGNVSLDFPGVKTMKGCTEINVSVEPA